MCCSRNFVILQTVVGKCYKNTSMVKRESKFHVFLIALLAMLVFTACQKTYVFYIGAECPTVLTDTRTLE